MILKILVNNSLAQYLYQNLTNDLNSILSLREHESESPLHLTPIKIKDCSDNQKLIEVKKVKV